MIAIDWGTSNFRAFLFDEAEAIVDRCSSPSGILQVPAGRFAETLREQIREWLEAGERRILLCGMVGSRKGWAEVPYVPCPASLAALAASVLEVPFEGAQVLLVPGVIGQDPSGAPEVMRGEETEAMGILDPHAGEFLVCHPGTHTKWIQLRDRTILSFLTYMTGEIFAALKSHTILAQLMNPQAPPDPAAFLRGVARSADPGSLLHHLFSVRSLALLDQLPADHSPSYLSGLLIGHEIRSIMPPGAHVHLVGAAPLCTLYAQAIQACGGSSKLEDEDAAARGLAAIGRRLSWI